MPPPARQVFPTGRVNAGLTIWTNAQSGLHLMQPARCFFSLENEKLVAVILDPRGAQAGQAVALDRALPAEEFLNRQPVAFARLIQ